MSRILILTEGKSNPTDAKTATGVIRYRRSDVVGVLDSTQAGRRAGDVLGVGDDIPIVADAGDVDADTLLIGIAPAGGRLPDAWREVLRRAISRGMRIVSGLHTFIGDDPELAALAREKGTSIEDLRRPPRDLTVSSGEARRASSFRVHTVGNDCSVGKMLVALELTRCLRERGRRAAFVATGQTGMMISGRGVAVDAVVSDFIAGAVEREVLAVKDHEFVLIEGQGSLFHPMYSGVTLGLLHGCAPQAMVLCLDASRTEIRHSAMPIPPLEEVVATYDRMASIMCPSRVVALALNTSALDEARAAEELARVRDATGLPASDPIRFGLEPILGAVLAEEDLWRRERGAVPS